MSNLFLICPECYIEQKIRNELDKNAFFLTALGSIFDFDQIETMEAVNQLVSEEDITHIYIVNDTSCAFINNTTKGIMGYPTNAEKELSKLMLEYWDEVEKLPSFDDKNIYLVTRNLIEQGKNLSNAPFLGTRIKSQEVHLSALIYNQQADSFKEFNLNKHISDSLI